MFEKLTNVFMPDLTTAEAHCDAPCGVYDPSQARVEAESVLQLTKKILDLKMPDGGDAEGEFGLSKYADSLYHDQGRASGTREASLARAVDGLFQARHLEKYPELHDTFWKAAKLCSAVKQESLARARTGTDGQYQTRPRDILGNKGQGRSVVHGVVEYR